MSISTKLAEKFNLTIGDKIRWHIVGEDKWVSSKIGQIHAEPISQGLIMSPDTLEDRGLNFTPTNIITDEKFGENFDSIKSVTSIENGRELGSNDNSCYDDGLCGYSCGGCIGNPCFI